MKRKLCCLIITIIMFFICGCSAQTPQLKPMMKTNHSANFGCAAAEYDHRIYYVSNELEQSGIYSMEPDGSDVKIEASNPSILNLFVEDDALNYCGLYEADDQNNSTLFITGYLHKVYQPKSETSSFLENTIMHYCTSKGIELDIGTLNEKSVSLAVYPHEKVQREDHFEISFEYPARCYKDGRWIEEPCIFPAKFDVYDDFFVCYSAYSDPSDEGEYYQYDEIFCVMDLNTEQTVFQKHYKNGEELQILGLNDGVAYFVFHSDDSLDNEMILAIDLATKDVRTNVLINMTLDDCIAYSMVKNDQIYVVTQNINDFVENKMYPRNQKLQRLDPNTLEVLELYTCDENEQILSIYDDDIITLKGSKLQKRAFEDAGAANEVTVIELSNLEKKSDDKFLTETAGDWLFLYRVYGGYTVSFNDDMGKELLYKVNLKTNERHENKKALDFSEMDSYRIDN